MEFLGAKQDIYILKNVYKKEGIHSRIKYMGFFIKDEIIHVFNMNNINYDLLSKLDDKREIRVSIQYNEKIVNK